MQIIQITNKKQLNDFVGSREHSPFLQSWEWGEFQEKVSGKVWRLGVEDNGEIIASAKIIKKSLPIGKNYFYCGRGPVINNTELRIKNYELRINEILDLLFGETEKLAREEGTMFLRFDPLFKIENLPAGRQGLKFKITQTLDVQPSKTLILDLAKTEEDLLKEMHQKTRYNIRLAEKKGVKIVEAGKERFEEFWHLLDQTSGRDKFRPHGRNYYEDMLKADKNFIKLFFAEYKNKPIAAGIFSFFGDTATYLHGGSADEYREAMAPHLLQWEVIKLAKSLGYKYFDFHGIDEEKWPGVTRFKMGFGGEEVNYPGTFDLIYDAAWYNVYKMIRKARRTF